MREKLTEILGLPADACEAEILARVGAWASERRRQQEGAAFERRLADLIRVTNMERGMAITTLRAQDEAARATA
jgi:hypothetical protein